MASKDLFKVKDTPMTTVGGSNYDDVSDYSVRKVISSKEGTITKVPVNNFDIANKKYVDDQLVTPGQSTTILVSGASAYKLSGALLLVSGANIDITQNGQQIKISGNGIGDALTSNSLSQFAATTSSALAGVISDETGSGLVVFNVNPSVSGANVVAGNLISAAALLGIVSAYAHNATTSQATIVNVCYGTGTTAPAVAGNINEGTLFFTYTA